MDRILQNTGGTIRLEIRTSDNVLIDPDANAVTVQVFDGADASHIASAPATRVSAGIYSLTVPAAKTALLDVYEARWAATIGGQASVFRTHYETVGGFFFTTAEARAFDSGALASTVDHPTSALVDEREAIESLIERGRVAFVPRGRRVSLDGSGRNDLLMPDMFVRELYSATVSDTAWTAAQVADVVAYLGEGKLYSPGGWATGYRNVELHYAHGLDQVPPEVKRIALKMLVHRRTTSPDEETDAKSESIGTYSVDYGDDGFSVLTKDDTEFLNGFRVPVMG